MFNNMNLAELFATSDQIGDKYLSPEEIAARTAQLAALADDAKAFAVESRAVLAEKQALVKGLADKALAEFQLL